LTKYFNTGTQELQEEYSTYIIEPLSDFTQLDEALSFWKQNSCRYPTLSRMARDYYAIPASSAPAERLFSTAGHLNSKKRNRTASKTLEMKVLFKYWQKTEEEND